jgi:hypothetical protein
VPEKAPTTGVFYVPETLTRRNLLCGAAGVLLTECSSARPVIEFTRVPPADKGGPDVMDVIEGRVRGAKPGQQIVLFAHGEVWWAEPRQGRLFAPIGADSRWSTPTHLGTEYAALLVDPGYQPPFTTDTLPNEGGSIAAIHVVPGVKATRPVHHTLQFSGYDWHVRAAPSFRGGNNHHVPANASVDQRDALHLRITGKPGNWSCAQVILTRSLGYGTYRLTLRDISDLDPAAVLAMYTLSDAGAAAADRQPREWDIEISRWGDPSAKNARYLVQPSYLNTVPFEAPRGPVTFQAEWQSGRLRMSTMRGTGAPVFDHTFTSGVPIPGDEKFRIDFYDYQRGPQPLRHGSEVVIEQFEYLP